MLKCLDAHEKPFQRELHSQKTRCFLTFLHHLMASISFSRNRSRNATQPEWGHCVHDISQGGH